MVDIFDGNEAILLIQGLVWFLLFFEALAEFLVLVNEDAFEALEGEVPVGGEVPETVVLVPLDEASLLDVFAFDDEHAVAVADELLVLLGLLAEVELEELLVVLAGVALDEEVELEG